jgi:hypothetical protein
VVDGDPACRPMDKHRSYRDMKPAGLMVGGGGQAGMRPVWHVTVKLFIMPSAGT